MALEILLMKLTYLHTELPELSYGFLEEGCIKIGPGGSYDNSSAMEICLATIRLATRLNIQPACKAGVDGIPYGADSDTLVFKAPLMTGLVNKKVVFLRGWKDFEGCVKGFNALGLMVSHVMREQARLDTLSVSELNNLKLDFLKSRGAENSNKIFNENDLKNIEPSELLMINKADIAIWRSFANRPIFCSTSSNMGISTHQALRLMQKVKLAFRGKTFSLLNANEGKLVIWAPDKRADFMNEEKTSFLKALEKELPQITWIKTYINRQQRDPGALKDALVAGGYFFPTNPQSKDEMQNLIFVALKNIEKEKKVPLQHLLTDNNIRQTLTSIDAAITDDGVIVRRGIESGIYGLMVPYVTMLEELLKVSSGLAVAVSTWNQASIGAALAAATLADHIIRHPLVLADTVRSELNSVFPMVGQFLDSHHSQDLMTRVHGVFDLANLQSLAQLLGVVVENHLSGSGTAYVGLGSSSYSNGNRCFEILRNSINSGGAFIGKNAFHASTHTINLYAQALIFGEDMYRYLDQLDNLISLEESIIRSVMQHVRKPEPAGAAAMAGYLLTRLDGGTLSMVELAYVLQLMGFSKQTLLEFAGFGAALNDLRSFLQAAYEEGLNMGSFNKNMLLLLDWPEYKLRKRMETEKQCSVVKYSRNPLDDNQFEQWDGLTAIYLTGDNCRQPSRALIKQLIIACWGNRGRIKAFLDRHSKFSIKNKVAV